MKKKLIIFDMDGTLINSGNVIANTINHVRQKLDLEVMTQKEILNGINDPEINPSDFFYNAPTFTKKHSELFESYYDLHCLDDICLYEGIENLLQTLSHNFLLSIATNASVAYAKKMTTHLHINQYFDFIIGSDSVDKSKPAPDMLLKTANTLAISIENAILIGDSNKDKNAALSCKMDYILVNWGFTPHQKDAHIIHNTQELEKLLLCYK